MKSGKDRKTARTANNGQTGPNYKGNETGRKFATDGSLTRGMRSKFFATEIPDSDFSDEDCDYIMETSRRQRSHRDAKRKQSTQKKTVDSGLLRHRTTKSVRIEEDYFVPSPRPIKSGPVRKNHRNPDSTDEVQLNNRGADERQEESYALCYDEQFQFGELYEHQLLQLVHKHLEVDTYHRVIYVGDTRGSLAPLVEDYFCLTSPVVSIFPGKINYKDVAENKKMLAYNVANVGAEQFFAEAAEIDKPTMFDRMIFHDCARYINNLEITFTNVMKVLHEFGKVLVIHRPGIMNTLPIFQVGKQRILEDDVPFMKIIKCLEKTGADVEWDLVHVPFTMKPEKWFGMLAHKFPTQFESISDHDMRKGLRELANGPFKYLTSAEMEAEDRVVLITASHRSLDCTHPAVQRCRGSSQMPYAEVAEIDHMLPLDDSLASLLKKFQIEK